MYVVSSGRISFWFPFVEMEMECPDKKKNSYGFMFNNLQKISFYNGIIFGIVDSVGILCKQLVIPAYQVTALYLLLGIYYDQGCGRMN